MIRVAAITSGRNVPSARYRVRQYVEPLGREGIVVAEQVPAIDKYAPIPGWPPGVSQSYALPLYMGWQGLKLLARLPAVVASHRHDLTWLQRELIPGLVTLEPLLRKPMVLDIDDAVWASSWAARHFMPILARHATVILAGNQYLAEHLSRWNDSVRVVYTGLDVERFRPASAGEIVTRREQGKCILGWTGSASTLAYLEAIEEPLHHVMGRNPETQLLVVADRPPRFRRIPEDRVRYERWGPSMEAPVVREMDIGLMPLPDSPWTRGKCSFKMIQYMASGIPSVVSPVGLNRDILGLADLGFAATTHRAWEDALEFLVRHPDARLEMGRAGRRIAVAKFNRDTIAGTIVEIFRSVAPRSVS